LVSAQKKIEGMNFDARKHLLDYDDILNKQRISIYRKRQEILTSEQEVLREMVLGIVDSTSGEEDKKTETKEVIMKIGNPEALRRPVLAILDTLWMNHLEDLESLSESVKIRAYGQHDPLVEYRRESHILYKQMLDSFDGWIFENLSKIKLVPQEEVKVPEAVAAELNMTPEDLSKVGRNDLCPCGSGKKFKKCHGA
jgi:preprotein translocase subunit SecA